MAQEKRTNQEPFLERNAAAIFVAIGLAMILASVAASLGEALAIALAGLGTSLIVVGVLLPRLEGAIKVGPQGLEATIRERKQQVIEATKGLSGAEEFAPEWIQAVRDLLAYVVPEPGEQDRVQKERDELLHAIEMFRRYGYDMNTAFSKAVRGEKPPTNPEP